MRSGQLRNRLTIERTVAAAANEYGEVINTWQKFDTVWGAVTDLDGNEAVREAQVHPDANVKVLTRYRPDVDETMRLVFDGRVLYPVAITKDVRKTEMTWFCREER